MQLAEVKNALQEFYSDRSRSQEETREGLEDLRDEIDTLIDTLR